MNENFRKVALISAALGLLLSLFFALRPDENERTAPTTGSQSPGTVHIDYRIAGGKPVGGIGRDSVARGRLVVIRVTSDIADLVHVHGYDLMADVAPGKPATIRFTATAPGRFELELEDRGLELAELEVRR